MNEIIYCQTPQEALNAVNNFRLGNKGHWSFVQVELGCRTVLLKFYETWLQVGKVEGFATVWETRCDASVKEWKAVVLQVLEAAQ
jgi:hypothetical protein